MAAIYATEVQSGFYARRFWNVQSRLALHKILVSDIRATKKIMQERLTYEVYLNIKLVRIFSSGAHLGEVETEKSTITLKYATDAERISVHLFPYSFKAWDFVWLT